MQQAEDFRAESAALYGLLRDTEHARFEEPTQFKDWTIHTVLEHLAFWNRMALHQLTNEPALIQRLTEIGQIEGGVRAFEAAQFQGLSGVAMRDVWWAGVDETARTFAMSDPKARLKWVGPDMSARTSITARLMETWAHGQEVYDHLGVARVNEDRIRNIIVLGVNTYSWTYKARGQEPPGLMPYLNLTAPSGAIWTYGEESETSRIDGPADAYCQVVTQTRNIADTSLRVTGPVATDWMSKAQCFAGAAHNPPPPGTRGIRPVANRAIQVGLSC